MRKNQNLGCYNIKFNFIADYGKFNCLNVLGIQKICEVLTECKHVYQLEIPERISQETMLEFKARIGSNKPSKKKGKGGKKGKKK